MSDLGLTAHDVECIVAALSSFPEVEEVSVFGSRAKGNFRNGSDVDLALKGSRITKDILSKISYRLNEETSLPYKFDVLNYYQLSNKELVAHIDRVGVCIYHCV